MASSVLAWRPRTASSVCCATRDAPRTSTRCRRARVDPPYFTLLNSTSWALAPAWSMAHATVCTVRPLQRSPAKCRALNASDVVRFSESRVRLQQKATKSGSPALTRARITPSSASSVSTSRSSEPLLLLDMPPPPPRRLRCGG